MLLHVPDARKRVPPQSTPLPERNTGLWPVRPAGFEPAESIKLAADPTLQRSATPLGAQVIDLCSRNDEQFSTLQTRFVFE
jgi:hypothetical protein